MKRYLKLQILGLLLTTLSISAETFSAMYTVHGSGVNIPIQIEMDIPSTWEIYKSKDSTKWSDQLFTKKRTVYMSFGFNELENYTPQSYVKMMTSEGYTATLLDNKTILTQEAEAYGGGKYFNVRMTVEKLALFIPMFPYEEYKNTSLDKELNELKQILASIKIISMPDDKAIEHAKNMKYDAIKKEIDNELASATLIDDDGTLEDVHSFCRSLDVIPFKYSQDKGVPQSVKDYAKNATSLCKGRLYTSVLTKHLTTKGKTSCKEVKVTFQDDFFIKSALRESRDIKMWDTLQKQYKTLCQKGN